MPCPKCGGPCERESTEFEAAIIHGPLRCPSCGWSEDLPTTMLDALKAADTGLAASIEFIRRHSGSEVVAWEWLQQNHAQVRAAITSAEERT